jgi:hypothetical protein
MSFMLEFSDEDKKIWDHELVRCRPDDEPGLSGKWDSASNSDDVFGPGTGNHGWHTWRPGQGLLFLNRPGQNVKGLELSLMRCFGVRMMDDSMGHGMAMVPSPPDRNGKRVELVWGIRMLDH